MAAKSANQQSDVLKELLECPVCLRTPTSTPIYQCKQGHLICRECRPRLTTCPVCRVHLDQMRSLLSEKVIEMLAQNLQKSPLILLICGFSFRLPNPCKFKAHGCTQEWMKSELGSHELKCQFRLIKCGNLNCPEMFVYSHLLKHMSRDHIKEDFIQNDDVGDICQKPLDIHEKHFGCEVVFAPLHLVYKGLHFFRQCWRNSSGRWFMWVNFPGSSDEAQDYIYTIKIMSKDKVTLSW